MGLLEGFNYPGGELPYGTDRDAPRKDNSYRRPSGRGLNFLWPLKEINLGVA